MFNEYSKYKDFYSQLYQKVKKFIKIFLDKQYDMIDIAQLLFHLLQIKPINR